MARRICVHQARRCFCATLRHDATEVIATRQDALQIVPDVRVLRGIPHAPTTSLCQAPCTLDRIVTSGILIARIRIHAALIDRFKAARVEERAAKVSFCT